MIFVLRIIVYPQFVEFKSACTQRFFKRKNYSARIFSQISLYTKTHKHILFGDYVPAQYGKPPSVQLNVKKRFHSLPHIFRNDYCI